MDSSSQQNAAILINPYSSTWPLMLDPLGMAEDWIKKSGNKVLLSTNQVCHFFFAANCRYKIESCMYIT